MVTHSAARLASVRRLAARLTVGTPLGRRRGGLPQQPVALASLAVASFGHLVQVIRHGLKKIQYQPRLIGGCLAGTGLALEPC